MVLPRRIELLVMPTSVCGAGALEPPQAARATNKATIAAIRDPVLFIDVPPAFL
jgi:hypothetical protein